MTAESERAEAAIPGAPGLLQTLEAVPRSARWVAPALAAAFEGTDASTLEPTVRVLLLLRVAAVDRAPYWRSRLEAAAAALGVRAEEIELVGTDEWETAPAFTDRERVAILWGDRVARRLARRDGAAYRAVREVFDDVELVELTALASLGAMADRITNALRIPPEDGLGFTPAEGPLSDDALRRWSRSMFDVVRPAWPPEMAR